MIQTVEQLKQERPDLVDDFEKMSHEELLNQIYLEAKDAINMEERVAVFMELCTPNMSYTTYTPESIRQMVATKQEQDERDLYDMILEDTEGMDVEEIRNYLNQ